MSLNFDVSKVVNQQVVTTHPLDLDKLVDGKIPEGVEVRWSPVTEAILLNGMAIGMGSITEKNWQDYYRRTYIHERVAGAMRRTRASNDAPIVNHYITPLDVKNHIGLTSNVSLETDAAFLKRVLRWAKDATEYELKALDEPVTA